MSTIVSASGAGISAPTAFRIAQRRTRPVRAGDPRAEGGRRVLFYSSDDRAAKAEVAARIETLGFFGLDLGPLAIGGRLVQFPGGPLPTHNLVKFG